MMSDIEKLNAIDRKDFGKMNGSEKLSFLGRAIVHLCSFGFLFPNVFVHG